MSKIKNKLELEERIKQKSFAVAHIAKHFAETGFEGEGKGEYYEQIARQMIAEGIRKIGDDAESGIGKGKYPGHEFWSDNARKLFTENSCELRGITQRTVPDEIKVDKSEYKRQHIVHEHVFPVEELIKKLLVDVNTKSLGDCAAMIVKHSIIAIVTGEEDERITECNTNTPIDWTDDNLWIRYKRTELDDGSKLIDHIKPDPRDEKAAPI